MISAMKWKAEEFLAMGRTETSLLLRETRLDCRLNALREIALTLLSEVEALKNMQSSSVNPRLKLRDEVQQFEIELIRTALERTSGNQRRAARLLGVKHTTLNAKIKRHKISLTSHRTDPDPFVQNQETEKFLEEAGRPQRLIAEQSHPHPLLGRA
jgi:DNA-binding NtrC family response regulator